MGSMNKVILIGNLGKDADLKYLESGAAVATFSMATTEAWKDKNGSKQERTEWHRVVLWGKTAETLTEYLVKGKSVCVEGKLQTRKWKDQQGQDRYMTEIRADRVVLLGGASGNGQKREGEDDFRDKVDGVQYDDDIPFSWVIGFVIPALWAWHSSMSYLA